MAHRVFATGRHPAPDDVRGFKNATNFIMIAYLRMSRLAHLPSNLLQGAVAPKYNALIHRCL